jgi:hypothetical protein
MMAQSPGRDKRRQRRLARIVHGTVRAAQVPSRDQVPGETGVMPVLTAILVQDSLHRKVTQIAQGTT